MGWMCKNCRAGKNAKTAGWFNQIWMLAQMKRGGYPFEKNDLTLTQWLGIAQLEAELESLKHGANY